MWKGGGAKYFFGVPKCPPSFGNLPFSLDCNSTEPDRPRGLGEASECRVAKIAARRSFPLTYCAINLAVGVIERGIKALLLGRRGNLGGIFRENLGEGMAES